MSLHLSRLSGLVDSLITKVDHRQRKIVPIEPNGVLKANYLRPWIKRTHISHYHLITVLLEDFIIFFLNCRLRTYCF